MTTEPNQPPLDDATLERLEQLHKAATPGKWYDHREAIAADSGWVVAVDDDAGGGFERPEDCTYVCETHNSLPALVQEVRRLWDELKSSDALMTHYKDLLDREREDHERYRMRGV